MWKSSGKIAVERKRRRNQWLKANCQATAPQYFILKFPKSEKEARPRQGFIFITRSVFDECDVELGC
jgi:hypothetical protein